VALSGRISNALHFDHRAYTKAVPNPERLMHVQLVMPKCRSVTAPTHAFSNRLEFRTMTQPAVTIAVFPDHVAAEGAVKTLAKTGIEMKSISIIGKNFHTEETPVGYFNAGDRAKVFGKLGAFWGGLFGLLFGSMFLFIPVFGHLVILGPLAAIIANTVEGAAVVGVASAIGGALSSLGVPKNSIVRYESELKADKFVVAVQGTAEEVEKARAALSPAAEGEVSTFKPEV
jgi:hypothetical protein